MDDLISRKAAIEAVNSYFGFSVEEEYGSAVQEVLNALPSAQTEQRWTPITEGLPKETGRLGGYLVSIGDWVGLAPFVDGKFWENYFRKSLFEFPVEAWMPMPEPYKGE